MTSTDIYFWMRSNLPAEPFILEIGAHHAEDSERFFEMFPRATIIAFEPDPRNIPVIAAKRHLFERHRFVLVPSAVGAADGTTTLYLSGGTPPSATGEDRGRPWTYSSSIRRPKEHLRAHPTVQFVGEATVAVEALDSYFEAKHGREVIDFVWADVQGAEIDMIRGGAKTMARTRFLFTEFDERELYEGQVGLLEIKSMLPDFSEIGRFENNVLLQNRTILR